MHTTTLRALLAACLMFACLPVLAVADGTQLSLPEGVDLAIVVFEDLQCPDCARTHPQLLAASSTLGVPLLIHDFPIKRHLWAFPAAVLARWFAAQSPQLEAEYREFVFGQQPGITPDNLRELSERFARERGVELPGDIDPDGRLAAAVQAVEVTDPDRLGAAVEALRSGRTLQPDPGPAR